jgi:hypothetical protein
VCKRRGAEVQVVIGDRGDADLSDLEQRLALDDAAFVEAFNRQAQLLGRRRSDLGRGRSSAAPPDLGRSLLDHLVLYLAASVAVMLLLLGRPAPALGLLLATGVLFAYRCRRRST